MNKGKNWIEGFRQNERQIRFLREQLRISTPDGNSVFFEICWTSNYNIRKEPKALLETLLKSAFRMGNQSWSFGEIEVESNKCVIWIPILNIGS